MVIRQKKLFWQIFVVNLTILLLTIIGVTWYSSRTFDTFYIEETGGELESRANLIRSRVVELFMEESREQLRGFVVDSGRASGTRITVIEPDGTVVADTNEDPRRMDNHRRRPEIDTAFSGETGQSLRFSNTLGKRLLYTAIPLYDTDAHGKKGAKEDAVLAVLRLAMPATAVDSELSDIRMKIIGGALLAALGAFVLTYLVSRNISRPLEDMTRGAENYARGDFSKRMLISRKATASWEIASLASAMDQMAGQLDEKIKTISDQHHHLEAVFSSMAEAVIAVDNDERIISINEAAARMFEVDRRGAQGRLLQEVIRNVVLHRQIGRILNTRTGFEDEIMLDGSTAGNVYLQTHAVPLYGGNGNGIGALIVLNDITRLRRLETMRSDFVANVSHELRTPITSIRGYVETLLDGALDDREDSEKFLEIVLHQSEQLEEIIDDLLALSRIEREEKRGEVRFERQPLLPIIEEAIDNCTSKAEGSGVGLVADCSEGTLVNANHTLLVQAIVNLVINAVTFSESGQEVTVRAREVDQDGQRKIAISVIDKGIGIAEEHLPRLFERFYRSDRARSRKAGGTGLGLAIVKHIVQAHGGQVDVRSAIGMGSEFKIILNA